MGNLLAVDAGGTSTRAVVLSAAGHCLGYGVAGSGNPISSGTEHAAREVVKAAQAALAQAASPATAEVAVLAMAGSRTYVSTDWITSALATIDVRGRIVLESDLLATFCSGAWEPDGYAVVAGTGSAAIRVHEGRQDMSADGLGWLLGDDGSGFWLGMRVVRAAAAELDNRGRKTALTPLLLAALGIPADASTGPGYDGVSGVGTPHGLTVFKPISPIAKVAVGGKVKHKKSHTFSAKASRSAFPGGKITKYVWSWGDGKKTTTTKPTAKHKYAKKGKRTIKVTVSDSYGAQNNGRTGSVSVKVKVK